ncbi:Na+/H+ antiporter [Gorillibacterium sp. CAU 1737]|uniref:Na+/H+ antiporter n=1 Tax=Gorillibacterium sp. CAU 1737 TaxID=3140362 RepID=UPI003261CE2E
METFLLVLVLLILIGVSHLIGRFAPSVPVPLIQIGLGVGLALLPMAVHIELEPELFFVLFIAPLLFNDGRRTPRDELWHLRAPILLLALGLVFFTVLVGGWAIHALIPSIPLPAAFALAAILSPTDAVAVSSMAGRVHLPRRIHRILEGESLINDASGLVAFKFAVAAAVSGSFSLPKAALSFVVIAVGGVVVGSLVGLLIIRLGVWIRRLGMEDVTMHVLLQLVTPFIIYLVAEELGVSGILAVVAAGVMFAVRKDRATSPDYKLQIVSASTWSVLLFILNGLVFLLLGLLIPDVMKVIYHNEAISNGQVALYVLLITAMLIIIRFLWIVGYARLRRNKNEEVTLRGIALTSISGVRGAVTLAGAFSIPLFTDKGDAFPERDLILALAAGVILVSLILASVVLPLLAGKEPEEEEGHGEEKRLMEIGMRKLLALARQKPGEGAPTPEMAAIQEKLMQLRPGQWQEAFPDGGFVKQLLQIRRLGLQAERRELERHREELDSPTYDSLVERLDKLEYMLTRGFDAEMKLSFSELGRLFTGWFGDPTAQLNKECKDAEGKPCLVEEAYVRVRLAMLDAAIAEIQEAKTEESERVTSYVVTRYQAIRARLGHSLSGGLLPGVAGTEDLEEERRMIQEQRNAVQRMYEDGTINRKIAGRLRTLVDELEASIWE